MAEAWGSARRPCTGSSSRWALAPGFAAAHGAAPQCRVDEATLEFRRIKPDYLYYAPELRQRVRVLVAGADVLHGHGFYVGTNYLFGRDARRQARPLVYHAHGIFEPFILRRSRWKKRLVHWLFEDANFRHARLWRALTAREADQIRATGVSGPIAVVPVGVDPAAFEVPYLPSEAILKRRWPRFVEDPAAGLVHFTAASQERPGPVVAGLGGGE